MFKYYNNFKSNVIAVPRKLFTMHSDKDLSLASVFIQSPRRSLVLATTGKTREMFLPPHRSKDTMSTPKILLLL